jgi:hypothetical protein
MTVKRGGRTASFFCEPGQPWAGGPERLAKWAEALATFCFCSFPISYPAAPAFQAYWKQSIIRAIVHGCFCQYFT